MFSTGDKVISCMTASSKKGALKVGSIGRVRNTGYNTVSVDPDSRDEHAIIFNTEVVFTRYGYEIKPRFESRSVKVVMPLIFPSYISGNISAKEAARMHIESIEKTVDKVDRYRDYVALRNSDIIGVMLPYHNFPIDVVNDEDGLSWFESVCRSRKFQELVIQLMDERGRLNGVKRKSGKYDWLDAKTLKNIHSAIGDRGTRLSILTDDKFINTKKAMKRIYDTSFDMSSVVNKVESHLHEYDNMVADDNADSIYVADDFFSSIYKHIYSTVEMAVVRSTVEAYEGNKEMIEFATNMLTHISDMMIEKFADVLNS